MQLTQRSTNIALAILLAVTVAEVVVLLYRIESYKAQIVVLREKPARIGQPPIIDKMVGEFAPPFTLISLDGDAVSIVDYFGQDVILLFFTTSCPGCIESTHRWVDAAASFNLSTKAIFAIGRAPKEELVEFNQEHHIAIPILENESGSIFKEYAINGVPLVLHINPDGIIEDISFF